MLRELKRLIKKFSKWKDTHFQRTTQDVQSPSPVVNVQWNSGYYDMATNATTNVMPMINSMNRGEADRAAKVEDTKDLRIEKKPVEVVAEIVTPEPVMALNDIKKQIKIVECRLAVLKKFHGQTTDEIMALRYLRARCYYEKCKKLFPWQVTTDALIEALVKKYKLQNVSFGSYSKSVPIEATEELEKFGKAWERVVDDDDHQPDIRLITDYKGPEYKKDPILYVSSPFGRWWYVLGAWDKEVEIVDQIVYQRK